MLEMLARGPLWRDGMNYLHGTGHGIGAALSCHEGPLGVGGGATDIALIANTPRVRSYLVGLEEGMYLSDEPGFYLEVALRPRACALRCAPSAPTPPGRRASLASASSPTWWSSRTPRASNGGRAATSACATSRRYSAHPPTPPSVSPRAPHGRARLRQVPMCAALVEEGLLAADERQWLNEFHAECRAQAGPLRMLPTLLALPRLC